MPFTLWAGQVLKPDLPIKLSDKACRVLKPDLAVFFTLNACRVLCQVLKPNMPVNLPQGGMSSFKT